MAADFVYCGIKGCGQGHPGDIKNSGPPYHCVQPYCSDPPPHPTLPLPFCHTPRGPECLYSAKISTGLMTRSGTVLSGYTTIRDGSLKPSTALLKEEFLLLTLRKSPHHLLRCSRDTMLE
ncbi:hypothetical protein JZ751_002778 [Albula glossodonta]|uniref:Uncharacterized protein n=1 Tax=Albula glossodonta TaxID=121402 RepID=A0A8T2NCA8_9TELE|nr:hypothetical protein JZ751_002778 [Albula glossodonta]